MSWIERLDKRAESWPIAGRASYAAVKWYLILLGGFMVIRLSLDRTGLWSLY
jgi:hypothetical protein